MMRPMAFSLPGMAEAEISTRSKAVMSTCLWLEKAMRYNADIFSPCEPVATMTSLFLGMDLICVMSTTVSLAISR